MKIEIKYSGSILNLPSSVADSAKDASKTDLQVIICIFEYFEYFSKFEECIPLIAKKLAISAQDVQNALVFWAQHGVILLEGAEEFESKMVGSRANEAPCYTGKQIAKFVEGNKELQALFFECQNILGKEFTKHDYDCVIQLKELYRFSDPYIMLFLMHCAEIGKTNWAYIRKLANEFYDEGITSYQKLEEHFAGRKNKNSLEYKVRHLIGLGNIEFTPKQRTIFERWVECKISFEMIKLAYDITLDTTGKVSMPYMAKIIENWINAGIKTVNEAQEAQAKYKKKQAKKHTPTYGDADAAFEAALARSYEEDDD